MSHIISIVLNLNYDDYIYISTRFYCLYIYIYTYSIYHLWSLSIKGRYSNICHMTIVNGSFIGHERTGVEGNGYRYLYCYHPSLGVVYLAIFYSIHVPGWLLKWLNLITAHGSVSNESGSVKWLATRYLKTVSWRNHTEKLTALWPQNISFWPKINIPSWYCTMLMLNCLENTLKLQFDSYLTAVKFLT